MENADIIRLYKQGYSIDYIVNQYYISKKNENKIINMKARKIILLESYIKKSDLRGQVYRIIYSEISKWPPYLTSGLPCNILQLFFWKNDL